MHTLLEFKINLNLVMVMIVVVDKSEYGYDEMLEDEL